MRVATDDSPSASATGLRTPTARGPILSLRPGARRPTAVASANASNVAISPIHIVAKPTAVRGDGDVDGLGVGTIQPERRHDMEVLHSHGGAGPHS